ncbi:hypothetical protein F5Y12DRAFT_738231 [Xylaria sp. FL1777]|nr:hypothetical protein F5Y12DRAFT_738231 [Xylaria sp. FL1777]
MFSRPSGTRLRYKSILTLIVVTSSYLAILSTPWVREVSSISHSKLGKAAFFFITWSSLLSSLHAFYRRIRRYDHYSNQPHHFTLLVDSINPRGYSLLLNGPAEFHVDATNINRIYLAITAELVNQFGFTIGELQGHRIRALFPPPMQSIMTPQPYFPASSSQFGYVTPPPTPQYPVFPQHQLNMAALPAPPEDEWLRRRQNLAAGMEIPADLVKIEDDEDDYNNDDDDNEEDHIKRPPNAWILYRQAQHPLVTQQQPKKTHNSKICK